jgi:hypothetical protein
MLWKVYFIGRVQLPPDRVLGGVKSNHYKVKASSAARAFSRAINYTEKQFKVSLAKIENAEAWVVTQEQWDAEDGYEKI